MYHSQNTKSDVRFNEEEKQDGDTLKDEVQHVVLELPCNPDLESLDAPGDSAPESTVRRSTRERCPPVYFGMQSSKLTFQSEPESFEAATTCSNSSKWIKAMVWYY